MYAKLKDGEIRVARVEHSVSTDGIALSLATVDLAMKPEYIALSYTWGDAENRHGRSQGATYTVKLSGRVVPVEENLHDALQYLGWRAQHEELPVFIDAICINQSDMIERSAQYQLIRQVYESATYIWCWLGIPLDESSVKQAVQLMRKFNGILADGFKMNGMDGENASDDDIRAVKQTVSPDDPSLFPIEKDSDCYKGWEGLMGICDRRYWQRTWVQQEATAQDDATWYWCGDLSFDPFYLCAALYFGSLYENVPNPELRFLRSIGTGGDAANTQSNGFISGRRLNQRGVLEILEDFRLTKATDPRDKLFAPRYLAADLGTDDLVPDYTKSTKEVYIDVVKFVLQHREYGLRFLGYVTRPVIESRRMKRDETNGELFPTWVPDWRDRLCIQPFCKMHPLDPVPRQQIYYASIRTVSPTRKLMVISCHLTGSG